MAGAQAQEPRAGRLQVRPRSRGITARDVEHARVEERSIVRHWVMRMTIHLFPAEDFGWLAPLFADRIANYSLRRLEGLGVADAQRDRALRAIAVALERDGEITRNDAMAAAAATGLEVGVEVRNHLSMLTIVGGTACVGPERGRESVFVATRDWIGEPQERDREWSMAELARRYFTAFAPAGDRDFAFWSGLPLTDCRAAIRKVGAGIVPVGRDRRGETMLAPRGWKARRDRVAAPRLLGSYDTLLMGYAQRDHALDPKHAKTVLPGGGILRPTILRAGRFVGTWSSRKTGKKLAYELAPFARLKTDEREALGREARDVARFEGLEKAVAAR